MKMKIILALALAAILIGANGLRAQYNHNDADLQEQYRVLNHDFFNDRLPANTSVRWQNIPMEHGRYVLGATTESPNDGSFDIAIDTKTNVAFSTEEVTLLHEMCHVATYDYAVAHGQDVHGPAFQACQEELYEAGAYKDLL